MDGSPRSTRFSVWPLLAAAAICILLSAMVLHASCLRNEGHLAYALDDAYIHMAMAKHWVVDGVLGVTPEGFTFATSSPLWTLLLAGTYALTGVSVEAPLVLNLICALASLVLVFGVLRRWVPSAFMQFIGLLMFLYLTPLVPMVFAGMEHCLHILLILALFFLGVELLTAEHPAGRFRHATRSRLVLVFAIAALAVMARYESFFLVAALALLFLLRRRPWPAVLLVLAGLLPVAVWGIVSVSHGGFLLPTSLMLKGHFPLWSSPVAIVRALGYTSIQRLTSQEPVLYALVVGAGLALLHRSRRESFWRPRALLPVLVILGCLGHLQFAKTGWFYRYDAYLHALGIVAILVAFCDRGARDLWTQLRRAPWLQGVAVIALALLILLPLHYRGKAALQETVPATGNIYEQQVQMGRFLRAYYDGASVAANDIGAINYYANLQCLDLWGLGTTAIAKARRAGTYSTETISRLTQERGTRIAIVYADWFTDPILPEGWRSAGRWTIRNSIVCGDETVEFFAARQEEFPRLVDCLQAFSDSLPPGVRETGRYRKP